MFTITISLLRLPGGVDALRFCRALGDQNDSCLTAAIPSFATSGGHPVALIRIYIKHGRLEAACNIASWILVNTIAGLHVAVKSMRVAIDGDADVTLPELYVPKDVLHNIIELSRHVLDSADPTDPRATELSNALGHLLNQKALYSDLERQHAETSELWNVAQKTRQLRKIPTTATSWN